MARTLKTLDVVSNGRMGWNAVTTSNHEVAANFGQPLPDRDTRYKMAHEHVEAVQTLWGTFGEDAYIHNKETGEFVDMSQVKLANYNGITIKQEHHYQFPLHLKDNHQYSRQVAVKKD